MKTLAVALQLVGAALLISANVLLFGIVGGLTAAGVICFAAGLAYERGW